MGCILAKKTSLVKISYHLSNDNVERAPRRIRTQSTFEFKHENLLKKRGLKVIQEVLFEQEYSIVP